MKQSSRIILAVIASLTLSLAGTAAAEHGSRDSGSSSSGEVETHSAVATVATETTPGTDDTTGSLRVKAQEQVTELRKEHKSKSADDRTKVCESHKQGLETKFSHIVANSQRIQDRISGVLDKAVAYKTDNNLDVVDYDNLLTKAMTAKQAAADSITALKAVSPSLDCNNTSVATDVATFKEAAKTTRDDLKTYRSAVKDLLKAIRDAKQPDSTTEGSN
jgi:hypothetical protein